MRRMWTALAGVALVVGMAAPAWSDHGHRSDRDGRHHDRYDRGYYGHGPYYGGYGCGYEYPCSTSYEKPSSDCIEYSDNGEATRDPSCRYSAACDCWYKTSESPREGSDSDSSSSARRGGTADGGTTGGGGGGA